MVLLVIVVACGQGVERDDQKAAALYTTACNAHVPDGCANLAVMYELGLGVDQSYEKPSS